MAIVLTGTGTRTAEAFDGTAAPVLHVEFIPPATMGAKRELRLVSSDRERRLRRRSPGEAVANDLQQIANAQFGRPMIEIVVVNPIRAHRQHCDDIIELSLGAALERPFQLGENDILRSGDVDINAQNPHREPTTEL